MQRQLRWGTGLQTGLDRAGLGRLLLATWIATVPAAADEVLVRNDSFDSGESAYIVGDFVAGEHAGVRLTSPCDGAIVAVQVAWLSVSQNGQQVQQRAIHIYANGPFPQPGQELLVLNGPLLTAGAFNEFRYADEAQTVPIDIAVTSGQRFYVTLEYDEATNIQGGDPSIIRDVDGCQAGKNVLYAIPGGWQNFCLYLGGDVVIRAVVDCDSASGACCLSDGTCTVTTAGGCSAAGGTYQGDFSDCGSVNCPQLPQACCFESTGGCLNLLPGDCTNAGGVPGGAGTQCATYECFPRGACCLPDGSCLEDVSPEACTVQGGAFQGDGTTCAAANCPDPVGACCFGTGFCLVLTEADCQKAGATWMGFDTDCTDASGNGQADDCEAAPCPGDANNDRVVDLADLSILLSSFGFCTGNPSYNPDADFDVSGCVDLGDLGIELAYFGTSCD